MEDQGTKLGLRVMSLNVWDIPIARHRRQRIKAICDELEKNETGRRLDIVGFQEAFMPHDRHALITSGRKGGLAHCHFFLQGTSPPFSESSGLLILSRFPIVEVAFWRYSVNGKPWNIHHFDYFCGKGCGLARVQTGKWGVVDVYVSHLVSFYTNDISRDEYLRHRIAQAYECARWIRMTQRGRLALLLTDLNSSPDAFPTRLLMSLCQLNDSLGILSGANREPTFARADNPYAPRGDLPVSVDYVFWRLLSGSSAGSTNTEEGLVMDRNGAFIGNQNRSRLLQEPSSKCHRSESLWKLKNAELLFTEPLSNAAGRSHRSRDKVFISDHVAVCAEFVCEDTGGVSTNLSSIPMVHADHDVPGSPYTDEQISLLKHAGQHLDRGIEEARSYKKSIGLLALGFLCAAAILYLLSDRLYGWFAFILMLLSVSAGIICLVISIINCNEESMALRLIRLCIAVDLGEEVLLKQGHLEAFSG